MGAEVVVWFNARHYWDTVTNSLDRVPPETKKKPLRKPTIDKKEEKKKEKKKLIDWLIDCLISPGEAISSQELL